MLEIGTEARMEPKHHPECVCLVAAFWRYEVYSWCVHVGCADAGCVVGHVMWGVLVWGARSHILYAVEQLMIITF